MSANKQDTNLPWPREVVMGDKQDVAIWSHPNSNLVLDFHGDPNAPLVVFSDGNHHMALEQSLQRFVDTQDDLQGLFYVTTPPSVLLDVLGTGNLCLGNLTLSLQPHLFISPPRVIDKIDGITRRCTFMHSCGNVLLVRKGNPKSIGDITDLLRDDVTLFISNPATEGASYQVYRQTILALLDDAGVQAEGFTDRLASGDQGVVHGDKIHHRELPQALASERADVAVVYYHLALRYTRIFPDLFELIPLPGSPGSDQVQHNSNVYSSYDMALLDNCGDWGVRCFEFLQSDVVSEIYRAHGLRRRQHDSNVKVVPGQRACV